MRTGSFPGPQSSIFYLANSKCCTIKLAVLWRSFSILLFFCLRWYQHSDSLSPLFITVAVYCMYLEHYLSFLVAFFHFHYPYWEQESKNYNHLQIGNCLKALQKKAPMCLCVSKTPRKMIKCIYLFWSTCLMRDLHRLHRKHILSKKK